MARGGVRTAEAHTGAGDKGADGDEVAASVARGTYTVARRAPTARAARPAVRRACTTKGGVHTAEAHTGAGDEGADGNKVAVSAARRVYAASGAADNPKAMTPVAGRTNTAQVAVCTAEANAGACVEGFPGEETAASAARRAYAASGLTSNPKAATLRVRRARTAGEGVRTAKAHAGASKAPTAMRLR